MDERLIPVFDETGRRWGWTGDLCREDDPLMLDAKQRFVGLYTDHGITILELWARRN